MTGIIDYLENALIDSMTEPEIEIYINEEQEKTEEQ
jgi:hypothetical protein